MVRHAEEQDVVAADPVELRGWLEAALRDAISAGPVSNEAGSGTEAVG